MDHAAAMNHSVPLMFWAIFFVIIALLMVFDLGIMQRGAPEITFKRSIVLSLIYVLVSCAFGTGIYFTLGAKNGIDFFTGYLIEKSLSADNIFIISLIFSMFSIPRALKHRVLFWGILGALVLRALFISLGALLVSSFHPVLYIFAVFLLFTGLRMLFTSAKSKNNPPVFITWLIRNIRATPSLHGNRFFVRLASASGKSIWQATPLFIALLSIECADILFAVDSVPAVFGVTTNPFIVYTSNIFAILGLRALYFTLDAMLHRFHYVSTALACVLLFIGAKILLSGFIGDISSLLSLAIIVLLLISGVIASMLFPKAPANL